MTALGFPVMRAADIPQPSGEEWLVESLWSRRAVGVIGGSPKLGKSWVALDLAVSVASGTPALDRFRVADPGPVLLFPAEDPIASVRARLEGISRHRGLDFSRLDVWLVQAPVIRLDSLEDREALRSAVSDLQPRLLILDPLIRCHAADENSATEVARVLSFLRTLEREHSVAVLVVHHARKNRAGDPGQGLRGSSEIYAWGDSYLYLRRRRSLELAIEHRSAVAPEPVKLKLQSDGDDNTFLVIDEAPSPEPDLARRIIELLREKDPLTREGIRSELGVRNQTVGEILGLLVHQGRIEKTSSGFQIKGADSTQDAPKPARPIPALCWGATP